MTNIKKIAAATGLFLALASISGPALANGYIRIGDECFVNMAAQGEPPILVQIACPREVSEYP